MVLRRTAHAVYDTKYHLVWAPKYRKKILHGELQKRVKGMFQEIAEQHEIEITEMEVDTEHVHILCSFPPRYSIAQVVGRLKSLSARAIFDEYPQVKGQLWGGEFWEDGYFARTVGDEVSAEIVRKYIQHHAHPETEQLELFD
jgi:putative transposase